MHPHKKMHRALGTQAPGLGPGLELTREMPRDARKVVLSGCKADKWSVQLPSPARGFWDPWKMMPVGRGRLPLGSSWEGPALLPGPQNSVLTIFASEPRSHPVGLWYKYQFIYSVSQ